MFIWNNIDYEETSQQCNLANGDPLSLWQKRLGHNNVEGIYNLNDHLETVHTDILGAIQPGAVDGHRYAIGFVDSFSRYRKLHFLRSRDEAIEKKFVQFFADKGQSGTLVCDGAGEYVSNDIKQLCRQKGVRLEFSAQ